MRRVQRLLADPAAVRLWLLGTLAGVIAALVAGEPVWAVVDGVAAVVVAVKTRRGVYRQR